MTDRTLTQRVYEDLEFAMNSGADLGYKYIPESVSGPERIWVEEYDAMSGDVSDGYYVELLVSRDEDHA